MHQVDRVAAALAVVRGEGRVAKPWPRNRDQLRLQPRGMAVQREQRGGAATKRMASEQQRAARREVGLEQWPHARARALEAAMHARRGGRAVCRDQRHWPDVSRGAEVLDGRRAAARQDGGAGVRPEDGRPGLRSRVLNLSDAAEALGIGLISHPSRWHKGQ